MLLTNSLSTFYVYSKVLAQQIDTIPQLTEAVQLLHINRQIYTFFILLQKNLQMLNLEAIDALVI